MKGAVLELFELSSRANSALMRGDVVTYRNQITLADDFVLFSPFGGKPTRASEMTEKDWVALGNFFKNGTLRQELVQAYPSENMVVLAIKEFGYGQVGGLPPQEWSLRVTLVYRREKGGWVLAHRHADPLVKGITLQEASKLAH